MADSYEEIASAYSEISKMFEKNSYFKVESLPKVVVMEDNFITEMTDDVEAFIGFINEFANENEKLSELQEKIFSAEIDECSSQILNCDALEKRSQWCDEVTSHLEKIVSQKNLLAWYLQQPIVSNFLRMHYSYTEDMKELFEKTVKILANFNFYVKSLNGMRLPEFEKSDKCIHLLTELLVSIRTTLKNANSLSVTVGE